MTIYHHSWSFMAEPLATVLWYAWKNIGKMEHTLAGRTRSLRKDRVLYNYDFKVRPCYLSSPFRHLFIFAERLSSRHAIGGNSPGDSIKAVYLIVVTICSRTKATRQRYLEC